MAAPKRLRFRRASGMPGLLEIARERFECVPDPIRHRKSPLVDHLMAGTAIFFFKFPSILAFDRQARGSEVLRPAFKAVFSEIQRGKGLEAMPTVDGRYLVSIDGTEQICSRSIECKRCSRRRLRSGETENFHRTVCACVVAPGSPVVLPLMPEMVPGSDGENKNDCESNAAERLLPNIRRERPAPEGLRPDGRPALQGAAGAASSRAGHDLHHRCQAGRPQDPARAAGYRRRDLRVRGPGRDPARLPPASGAELNDSNRDLWADVPVCRERIPERKVRKAGGKVRIEPPRERAFGWTADIEFAPGKLMQTVRADRARWKVENETFNTLKTFDNLEHGCGHGKNWLGSLMENGPVPCCPVFRAARKVFHARKAMWDAMRSCV